MKKFATGALVVGGVLCLTASTFAQPVPQLNEIVTNDISTDDVEFVEICADPGTDLSAFTVVEIEGDGGSATGTIDKAIGLTGLVGANGLYVLGHPLVACADQVLDASLENGGSVILLVRNFTGSVGDDIDADDDCVEDGPFPGIIVDGIGTGRPSQGDCIGYYGVPALGPDTGNEGTSDYDPAGTARCEDCTGDWGMICLDGTEGAPGCLTANPDGLYNVDYATPCEMNACGAVPVDDATWGQIKGAYK